jgi:hypothetical protein
MRIFTASVIVALSLGTPAFVQAQGAPSQPEAQKPPAQSLRRQARKIFRHFASLLTRHRRQHPRLRPRALVHHKSLLSTSPTVS